MFNYKKYIAEVLDKKIIVCETIFLAVKRHVSDLEKSTQADFNYYFSEEQAERAINFIQLMKHSTGEWRGKPLILEAWQQFVVANVFGWRHKESDFRRFKKVYVQVARKNGKSTMVSAIGNYCFFADFPKEHGTQVYFIATKKDQAKIAWGEFERQIRASKSLNKLAVSYKQSSTVVKKNDSASRAKPLGQNGNTEDGLNPHLIVVDEYHEYKDNELLNVLESGTGARRQPLTFIVTTAGFDKNGVCFREYEYAKQILNATLQNEKYFCAIFEPDETDDWTTEIAAIKANPNLNVSVKPEFISDRVREAFEKPYLQVDVLTKNLNVWTQSATVWLQKHIWDEGSTAIDFEALCGKKCFVGLDLSTTRDITACVLCFPVADKFILVPRLFMPKDNIRERSREDRVSYELWAEQGFITLCPGEVINFDMIEDSICRDASKYEIAEVAYDPWKAFEIIKHLEQKNLKMQEIKQTFSKGGLSEATALFEKMVLERRVVHGGNPVLDWMMSCTEVRTDGRDNYLPMKPDRRKNSKRIDGIVASIMALHSAVRNGHETPSVYETRGVLYFN